jgi:hypothetical protein
MELLWGNHGQRCAEDHTGQKTAQVRGVIGLRIA